MTLGIFVEGQSDQQTLPILLGKIGYSSGIRHRRVPQGDMLDATKMSAYVRVLKRTDRRLDRIIIFRDSEGADPGQTLARTAPVSARTEPRFQSHTAQLHHRRTFSRGMACV